jgi:FkbM family methyltransferase
MLSKVILMPAANRLCNGGRIVFMHKRLLLLFAPGTLLLLVGVTGMIAGPVARTEGYFAFQRNWFRHCPVSQARYLPLKLVHPRDFVPVWVELEPRVKMLLDPLDEVSQTILVTGEWEPNTWAGIRKDLSPGATFVDVGAHIGYYSLVGGAVVGPGGHVLAVEPNPETLQKLRANIEASGASQVRVEPVACSDTEATLELYAAPRMNTGETSLSKANAAQEGQGVTVYRVPARPLDAIIREEGVSRVDVIKIDVEGAEMLVLKGAKETLARYHPIVVLELADHQLQNMGSSVAEVRRFLAAQGYAERHSFASEGNYEFAPATAAAHNY